MTKANLRARTKQALGNRTSTTGTVIDDTWYDDRVYEGMRRLATFQGMVTRPGATQPQWRSLKFFELEDRQARTLSSALTSNFVTPSPSTNVAVVLDVYDRTNNRGLKREALRGLLSLDPDETGTPIRWCPAGDDGSLGYYIHPKPSTSSEEIAVYEYVYKYPTALATDNDSPTIPDDWHPAIWMFAAEFGAELLDWPEKAAEMKQMALAYIAERKSPHELSAYAGRASQRRYIPVGSRY